MAPNLTTASALFLTDTEGSVIYPSAPQSLTSRKTQQHQSSQLELPSSGAAPYYEWSIVWRNVLAFIYLHGGALYGLYLVFTTAHPATFPWAFLVAGLAALGVTAGAHRLWCHRAYKAKWPLRLILAILQTVAFQNHIYEWVRDHRVHHKFAETDADPHNSKRGFFFSHIGWLMVRKHPDVINKGRTVDMSDLLQDPIVVWQMRTYLVTLPLVCFVLPTWVPIYFWNEDPWTSWYVASILRYTLSLNLTWLVNSAAHIWGTRPFDKNISATDNVPVAVMAFGEGWHNYHHAFPWDYKAGELGNYRTNFSTGFIDMFAKIGWAYDLKTVSPEMIKRRAKRSGDGTYWGDLGVSGVPVGEGHDHEGSIWGWGDKDMPEEDIKDVLITHKSEVETS
uniref:Fatty acid desaturase domain-containing protein n=1 Tax=Timema bartmani TaxID=61472 RepID=A0A7R9I938_9NEOP|nr:unnamed protein product [Timema bartmani]